jgi:hypothetical protein
MHVFTRYIATYFVVPAALIGAFALGTSTHAAAAPEQNDWRPGIVAAPTVTAQPAAGPGTSHSSRRHMRQNPPY